MERKDYRLYFHKRDGDDPNVWSVDEGTQSSEIHVQWFVLQRIVAGSKVNLKPEPGQPSGWIAIDNCFAEFRSGGVVFTNEETA